MDYFPAMERQRRKQWILVTGASLQLSAEEINAAEEVGIMLAREGFGLIVGDWDGIDRIVMSSFLELLPEEERASRIKHIANRSQARVIRVPGAEILPDDGASNDYSLSSILAADAGIIVSGREGSKPSMEALLRHGKPVLPVPFLGWDAFQIYKEILSGWTERSVPNLTERQFLELMIPWRNNPRTLFRLLRASLTTEPEIFISYRRSDVPAAAGRIFEELTHAYGLRAVFIDYESIDIGETLDRILECVKQCRVLVAIIGPGWNADRLRQEDDYVRREIETAAQSGLNIVPLLVERNAPPPREELPESLSFLWDHNFAVLQMNEWQSSIRRLREAVDKGIFGPLKT